MIPSSYWSEWQKRRVDFLIGLFGEEFFRGKRILELGAFNGWIGNCFHDLGADVTCVDGRDINVNEIRQTYPHLKVHLADLDTEEWNWGDYDIIINFGLLYHLEKHHKEHIENCIKHCRWLFLESVIFDSEESEVFQNREGGRDQSLSGSGGNPSTKYVEDIFDRCPCVVYTKHLTDKLNSPPHTYDWEDKNTKQLDHYRRRFWIVENTA